MSGRDPGLRTKAAYSPPILIVYGRLAQMTASGTGDMQEVTQNPLPTRFI
jgi:hypothetical protein